MPQIEPIKPDNLPFFKERFRRLLREAFGLILIGSALVVVVALISFAALDPGWRVFDPETSVKNHAGRIGAFVADLGYYFFGLAVWMFPLALAWAGGRLFFIRHWSWVTVGARVFFLLLFVVFTDVLLSFHASFSPLGPTLAGGIVGSQLSQILYDMLGLTGSTLLLLVALPIVLSLYTDKSLLAFIDVLGYRILWSFNWTITGLNFLRLQGQRLSIAAFAAFKSLARASYRLAQRLWRVCWLGLTKLGGWLKAKVSRSSPHSEPPSLNPFSQQTGDTTSDNFEEAEETIPTQSAERPAELPPASEPAPAESASAPNQAKVDSGKRRATKTASKKSKSEQQLDEQKDLWQDELPPHSLLSQGEVLQIDEDQKFHTAVGEDIIRHLADFGVKADITGVVQGPVVTRYEIQPAAGVKASKISGLSNDLARSLSVLAVRVVEVIPGKSVVGIEVPNRQRQIVHLAQIIDSKVWRESSSGLPLALGMDISGKPVIADLSRMPHLLVAGTTGSGKSVALNTMLVSLLYHSSANLIRLIMIDPKMLELSVYEGISHLLTNVITDMRQASKALAWCVREMDRRYSLMAALGVRNIQGYNHKIKMASNKNQRIEDPRFNPDKPEDATATYLEPMPYIVVVIDEYADMMMVVGKKVETLIMRLSQKARAAGIHLILATQRPSVDVVTGLIKSNIPNRIAFQVSSRIDSRTILDQSGAEQLLGHGDMLMIRPGMKYPLRVHGAFVSDDEVHRIVEYLKLHASSYDTEEDILAFDSSDDENNKSGGDSDITDEDEVYVEAVKIVRESGRASISYLQRRLRIGYNRSASLLEKMEQAGIVSGGQDGNTRIVLGRQDSASSDSESS